MYSIDARPATLQRPLRDLLGYFEPLSDPSSPQIEREVREPSMARHAIFLLDATGCVRSKNFLAQELLDEAMLFRVEVFRLVPFLDVELPYWERQLHDIRRERSPRIAVLGGRFSRVAVGLSLRQQGDVEVHVESGLPISDDVLQIFCDSVGITSSEREVLRWVLTGLRPKAIAQVRSRSEATVRSHIKNILAKSGCSSVQELASMVTRLPAFI